MLSYVCLVTYGGKDGQIEGIKGTKLDPENGPRSRGVGVCRSYEKPSQQLLEFESGDGVCSCTNSQSRGPKSTSWNFKFSLFTQLQRSTAWLVFGCSKLHIDRLNRLMNYYDPQPLKSTPRNEARGRQGTAKSSDQTKCWRNASLFAHHWSFP